MSTTEVAPEPVSPSERCLPKGSPVGRGGGEENLVVDLK